MNVAYRRDLSRVPHRMFETGWLVGCLNLLLRSRSPFSINRSDARHEGVFMFVNLVAPTTPMLLSPPIFYSLYFDYQGGDMLQCENSRD